MTKILRQPRHPPIRDYSAAVASAIAWLGDRYLLAQPVNLNARRRRSVESMHVEAPDLDALTERDSVKR